MVGHPKGIHPSTANMTNLDVAKVLTVIDPRKPLPEGVNVKFETGEVRRIRVSSPWMPPICSHCRGVGHSIKRCSTAPVTCTGCKSTIHNTENCPRAKAKSVTKKKKNNKLIDSAVTSDQIQAKVIEQDRVVEAASSKTHIIETATPESPSPSHLVAGGSSSLISTSQGTPTSDAQATIQIDAVGGSLTIDLSVPPNKENPASETGSPSTFVAKDCPSIMEMEKQFTQVLNKRQLRSNRGKGPSLN